MIMDERDAFMAGMFARHMKESRSFNPFEDTDPKFAYWNQGWDDSLDNDCTEPSIMGED